MSTAIKGTAAENLPEGILRSTFLPEDTLSGTRLFLVYREGRYYVETRFQYFKRTKFYDKAVAYFEAVEMGEVKP
jgi:hypothetical protein